MAEAHVTTDWKETVLSPAGAMGALDDVMRDLLERQAQQSWGAAVNAMLQELRLRPLHLAWKDGEWVDNRCTSDPPCRFHPDDDNGTHGGRMHVHECAAHEPQEPSS